MSKLTPCKTCGHQIAKKAKTCPSCGAKNKPPTSVAAWFALFLIIAVTLSAMFAEPPSEEQREAAKAEREVAKRPIAGTMTERDICQTAGYLIRRSLSTAFKTINVPCSVTAKGDGEVEVESGYRTPEAMGERLLTYTAQGVVNGDTLRLNTIRVHGVDDEPIDFAEFGF
ncbi:MAG: zinc ribbon domain-containing protein [Lamprobacter sp.]|uniref:zinc ribbon domain-containing protein n=1 Tax=Lamprobacter sp. TaxID=3100796 RepID=UPI002B2587C6|nr:zinc ribbon domain-containing protein [Lamprobacter sp.]MEA3638852.1 zinc ribbon domain-containing protein [Lamprobacter sp.]